VYIIFVIVFKDSAHISLRYAGVNKSKLFPSRCGIIKKRIDLVKMATRFWFFSIVNIQK